MLVTQAVHLLLFSEQGLSFGVPAGQVKELVKADSPNVDIRDGEEPVLFYKGRELRLIRLVRRWKLQEALKRHNKFLCRQDLKAKEGATVLERDELPPLEQPARILIVRHCHEGDIGVQVECLEQLRLVPLARIFRLPLVMERKKRLQSVWGLTLVDERLVVLVDLEHI